MLFSPETASFRKPSLAPGGGAQNRGAALARDRTLRVGENGRDGVAARTFHIHKITVRMLDEPFFLVGTSLFLSRRMKQVYSERHLEKYTKNCIKNVKFYLQVIGNRRYAR